MIGGLIVRWMLVVMVMVVLMMVVVVMMMVVVLMMVVVVMMMMDGFSGRESVFIYTEFVVEATKGIARYCWRCSWAQLRHGAG